MTGYEWDNWIQLDTTGYNWGRLLVYSSPLISTVQKTGTTERGRLAWILGWLSRPHRDREWASNPLPGYLIAPSWTRDWH